MSLFDAKIAKLKQIVEQELLLRLEPHEPYSLYEPMYYTLAGGGKRLRPVLVLLACEAVGGKTDAGLDAALAIELLHNFTLVHDDIMDQDDIRRGRATVHKKWNESVAILAGDGLLALAYESLMNSRSSRIHKIGKLFSKALLTVCEGQALDSEFERRAFVSMPDYLTMISKKTAQLFAVSCQIGALCGGGSEVEAGHLRQYGEKLGLAFQIQDDLLDITSNEKNLGKTYASDIRQGKKTFLVVYAYEQASDHDKEFLEDVLSSRTNASEKITEVLRFFKTIGSIDAAKTTIDDTLKDAEAHLQNLPDSQAKRILKEFLKTLVNRIF